MAMAETDESLVILGGNGDCYVLSREELERHRVSDDRAAALKTAVKDEPETSGFSLGSLDFDQGISYVYTQPTDMFLGRFVPHRFLQDAGLYPGPDIR
jgi:hypothetical protein